MDKTIVAIPVRKSNSNWVLSGVILVSIVLFALSGSVACLQDLPALIVTAIFQGFCIAKLG